MVLISQLREETFHVNFKSGLPTLWPSLGISPGGHGPNQGETRETGREFASE